MGLLSLTLILIGCTAKFVSIILLNIRDAVRDLDKSFFNEKSGKKNTEHLRLGHCHFSFRVI